MGELVPVMCDEVVPGDTFKINNQVVIRMQPMLAPMIHEVNCYVHYFFVPYRLLWSKWESFITGGEDGQDASILPRVAVSSTDNLVHSVWDYLGFPTGVMPDLDNSPLAFPFQAYVKIWNEFYRDQNLQDELELDYDLSGSAPISELLISGNYTFKGFFIVVGKKTTLLPLCRGNSAVLLRLSRLLEQVQQFGLLMLLQIHLYLQKILQQQMYQYLRKILQPELCRTNCIKNCS